jgi:hypothetical protein
MSEFAHVCIYLVISPLVYLIPLGVPFASNSSTCPEKLSANKCGWMRLLPLTRGRWLDGAALAGWGDDNEEDGCGCCRWE